jgi:hypothetical protein
MGGKSMDEAKAAMVSAVACHAWRMGSGPTTQSVHHLRAQPHYAVLQAPPPLGFVEVHP